MSVVYEIRARGVINDNKVESISQKEKRLQEPIKTKKTDDIVNTDLSKTFNKTIAVAASINATSQAVLQPVIRHNIDVATASGDYITAKNISINQAKINKGIGFAFDGLSIMAGFAIGGPVGAAAMGVSVGTRYISSAINRGQTNALIRNLNNVDNFIGSYEASRLIAVRK